MHTYWPLSDFPQIVWNIIGSEAFAIGPSMFKELLTAACAAVPLFRDVAWLFQSPYTVWRHALYHRRRAFLWPTLLPNDVVWRRRLDTRAHPLLPVSLRRRARSRFQLKPLGTVLCAVYDHRGRGFPYSVLELIAAVLC